MVILFIFLFYSYGLKTAEKCGSNCFYEFPSKDTLVISGSGDMYNWAYQDSPFSDQIKPFTTLIIEKGITSIGDNAFNQCKKLHQFHFHQL